MEKAIKILSITWSILRVAFVIFVFVIAFQLYKTQKETRISSTYLNVCVQKGVCPTPAQLSAIKETPAPATPAPTAPTPVTE